LLSSSHKEKLNLNFNGLIFANFVDKNKLFFNLDNFINEVQTNSVNRTLDVVALKSKITSILSIGYDRWQLCCGHDLVEILFIGLMLNFGNPKFYGILIKTFKSILRLTYDYSDFRKTNLYNSIIEWQKINPRYKCLV